MLTESRDQSVNIICWSLKLNQSVFVTFELKMITLIFNWKKKMVNWQINFNSRSTHLPLLEISPAPLSKSAAVGVCTFVITWREYVTSVTWWVFMNYTILILYMSYMSYLPVRIFHCPPVEKHTKVCLQSIHTTFSNTDQHIKL